MSQNLYFVLGTLASWLSWITAGLALVRLIGIALPGASTDRVRAFAGVALLALVSAIAFLLGDRMQAMASPHELPKLVPLVWIVMPFAGWMAAFGIAMMALRGAQAVVALPDGRRGPLRAAFIWAAFVIFFLIVYQSGTERLQVLRGGIDLTFGRALAVFLLIVAASAAMKALATRAATRGWSKAVLTHVLLIAGSIVFGLPFAFLLVTSFKEDRDMASPNGIVWIPKVQQTVQYMDPKDPNYEGQYEGRRIEGSIVQANSDGTVQLEITRPASMRGLAAAFRKEQLKEIPKEIALVTAELDGRPIQGKVVEDLLDGRKRVEVTRPGSLVGVQHVYKPSEVEPVREVGLRWRNYTDALEYMPPETANGLVYLKNTLIIVILSVLGTVLSSSVVAYAFARMHFPGRNVLFAILLGTMMLPSAVTLLPKFLLFRSFGWIDTLYPLWVPSFFASAFNVFLLRQFFKNIPAELEDAARIDGCNPAKTFWSVMLPLVKPALAVIAIWGFMNAWNDFINPLIYISSPEHMPLSYALQLFQGEHGNNEPGLMMAFATMTMVPVLLLFFFAQKYFVEGVTLSGLGGR